jgi:hypothetical protein
MKKGQMIAFGLTSVGIVSGCAIGAVSADSTTTNSNVGSSAIPRTVFKQEKLDAASEVLNTSTTNIQAAHNDKTFSTLITNAGLTKSTFHEKFKTQLTTDLESKGYSQDQVTIALQHRMIEHMRHHDKKS